MSGSGTRSNVAAGGGSPNGSRKLSRNSPSKINSYDGVQDNTVSALLKTMETTGDLYAGQTAFKTRSIPDVLKPKAAEIQKLNAHPIPGFTIQTISPESICINALEMGSFSQENLKKFSLIGFKLQKALGVNAVKPELWNDKDECQLLIVAANTGLNAGVYIQYEADAQPQISKTPLNTQPAQDGRSMLAQAKLLGKYSESSAFTAHKLQTYTPPDYMVYFASLTKIFKNYKIKKKATSSPNALGKRLRGGPKKKNFRFPKGPLLRLDELRTILQASAKELSNANAVSILDALRFLQARQYYTWIQLPIAVKLELGSLAWNFAGEYQDALTPIMQQLPRALTPADVKDTPAYRYGRSAALRQLTKVERPNSRRVQVLRAELENEIVKEWIRTFVSPHGKEIGPGQDGLSACTITAINNNALNVSVRNKSPDANTVLKMHNDAMTFLKKVLIILQTGLQIYDNVAKQYNIGLYPAALALSHGGRVNIRIPALVDLKDGKKPADKNAMIRWLGMLDESGQLAVPFYERDFGTHWLQIGRNKGKRPGTGMFEEKAGKISPNLKKLLGVDNAKMYGLDIAAGGIGRADFNGDLILPDGGHGHVFILYIPPTDGQDGGLQIGIETTSPSEFKFPRPSIFKKENAEAHIPSPVGYVHDASSSEASANPESSFGGLKEDKIGDQENSMAILGKKYGDLGRGRYVNLVGVNDGDWLQHLQNLEKAFDDVKTKYGVTAAYDDLVRTGDKLRSENSKKDLNYVNFYLASSKQPLTRNGTAQQNTSAHIVSSRGQTYGVSGGKDIVTTQDAILAYREMPANKGTAYGFGAIAANHPLGGQAAHYRTMTYRAALVNWVCPEAGGKAPAAATVTPLENSGIAFGCSVRLAALKGCYATNFRDVNQASDLFTWLVAQLRVSAADLKKFLTSIPLAVLNRPAGTKVDIVLLESSWDYPADQNFSIKAETIKPPPGKRYQIEDLLNKYDGSANLQAAQLNALRLRLRQADQIEWPENSYKLGFVKDTADFKATNKSMTYAEGVIDLYTMLFNQPAPPPAQRPAGDGRRARAGSVSARDPGSRQPANNQQNQPEKIVPGVAFFHP